MHDARKFNRQRRVPARRNEVPNLPGDNNRHHAPAHGSRQEKTREVERLLPRANAVSSSGRALLRFRSDPPHALGAGVIADVAIPGREQRQ
jgi:hypothetical protein